MDVGEKSSDRGDGEEGVRQQVDAIEIGKKPQPWTIALAAEEMRGRSEESRRSFTIRRDDLLAKLSVINGLLAPRCLSIKNPKVTLRLEPDGFRAVKEWAGQHILLRGVLKQRLGWALPIGILFLLGSLPVEADPGAGVEAIPFDVFSALMGGFLLIQGAAAQKWPHPTFLLLDSVWFAALSVSSILGMVTGGSPLWALAILLQVWLTFTGARDWNRLRQGTY